MKTNSVEEKKKELIKERDRIQEKLQYDYTTLGAWICTHVDFPVEGGPHADYSHLINEINKNNQFHELLLHVGIETRKMDEIKKTIAELELLKICPTCGNVVEDDERFCAKCGARLFDKMINADENICPQCGRTKKGDSSFCVYCGYKFDDAYGDEPAEADDASVTEPGEAGGEDNETFAGGKRFCIQCGTELPEDVLFCHICGCRQPE